MCNRQNNTITMEENIVLSIKNLSKKFYTTSKSSNGGYFLALKNISFDIERGKITGIIGSNGAGKSTLLKILAEVIPPSEGSIEYKGNILSILDIGTGFHHDLSGYENIFLNASLLGMKKTQTEKVLEQIIDFSGIRDFIHEPVKSYSSGMYLRLAFSIALHADFDIILLDEVISVGDAEFRVKALEKLKERIRQGKTCIVISHDLPSIMHLCDDCIILEKGQINFKGPVKLAVEEYINSVNASLHANHKQIIEHKKCKFISCTVKKEAYYMDEPVKVIVNYEKRCAEDIDIVIKVKNYDNYILSDCEIYRPNYSQKKLAVGVYQTTCTIPANLFNVGNYKIDLLFGDKVLSLLNLNSIAKFKIQAREWEHDKKWNEENTIIPFRPLCDWKTVSIVK